MLIKDFCRCFINTTDCKPENPEVCITLSHTTLFLSSLLLLVNGKQVASILPKHPFSADPSNTFAALDVMFYSLSDFLPACTSHGRTQNSNKHISCPWNTSNILDNSACT